MKRVISHVTTLLRSTKFYEFSPLNNETKVKLKVVFVKDSNVALVEFIVAI